MMRISPSKNKEIFRRKELTNDQMAVVEKIFNCNLTDLFMNYGFIGGYINIGGVYGSDSENLRYVMIIPYLQRVNIWNLWIIFY